MIDSPGVGALDALHPDTTTQYRHSAWRVPYSISDSYRATSVRALVFNVVDMMTQHVIDGSLSRPMRRDGIYGTGSYQRAKSHVKHLISKNGCAWCGRGGTRKSILALCDSPAVRAGLLAGARRRLTMHDVGFVRYNHAPRTAALDQRQAQIDGLDAKALRR